MGHRIDRRDFMQSVMAASLAPLAWSGDPAQSSGDAADVTVHVDQRLGAIDPRVFGYMTEDTLTSYEGGILSEMLFNRKFEIPESRDIGSNNMIGVAFLGTGDGWEPVGISGSVTLVLDQQVYYSPSQSQRIMFAGGDVPAGVQQRGYQYALPQMPIVPRLRIDNPFHFKPGERYRVRLAIKNRDLKGSVYVALGESYSQLLAQQTFDFSGGEDWKVYECVLAPSGETSDGKFMVYINSPGTIWIDSASMVREDLDEDGFRKDALEVTRRLKPTCIRWPGGLFVSDYHWMDGIGPRDKRPARLNRSWLGYTNNEVGIDEFMELCRKLNAQPYVCVNVGTGSAEEAAALVEYANGAVNTRYGRMRAAHGNPKPYGIKTWNVGNEEYFPFLGATDGSVYAKTFEAYARAMRAVDPSLELVACGLMVEPPKEILQHIPPDHPARKILRFQFDWNEGLLPVAGRDITYYSIHDYAPEGVKGLNAQDQNRAAMVKAENLSAKVDHLFEMMEKYVPGGRHIPIALDEWAVNLPHDAPPEASPQPPAGMKKPSEPPIGFDGTLREAVAGAAVYNLMQRRAKDFALANRTILYAFKAGMIAIGRDQVVETPVALSAELYSTYDRCAALKVETAAPTFDVAPNGDYAGAQGANLIDASARLGSDGMTLEVFLVNRDLDQDIRTTLRLSGRQGNGPVEIATLNGSSLTDGNSFEQPDRVKIEHSSGTVREGQLELVLLPHSLCKLTLRLT
jgi:alpha-N-arabinofuranosidase